MKTKDRYPKLKRDAEKKALCRGCGAPVPKGRQSWCSNKCFHERCPQMVRHAVFKRDKGICSICGIDTVKAQSRYARGGHYGICPEVNHWESRFRPNGINSPFDWERFKRAQAIRAKHLKRWTEAQQKRRAHFLAMGFPKDSCRDFWEADHIIPHSEGGPYVLENMRTLCVPCHKARTKQWHKERKRELAQLLLSAEI